MKKWYTLHTKPHSEYKVAHWLQRQSIETYLPEFVCDQTDKTGKLSPLFPCYLFLKIDMDTVSPSQWQWTPGLRRIVTIGSEPVAIPQDVIDLVKSKLVAINANGGLEAKKFNPGDTVRIKTGPFSGMLAVFQKQLPSEKRVQILLDFLGKMNRVNVEVDSLEKAPNHTRNVKSHRKRRSRGRGRLITNTAHRV